ncbi:NADPH-dependent F420 reductase [Paramicrobacterium fandaimingii]|uniref:NADPH-dependent F420 reductase n=1 Tax=Paramicrobacterium fandaimingii TaxID=2708079 RepID=UPI00141FEC9F|nr:NAD(P)-binding domain-containing protein [Microbacterium fandaimingii]
MIRTIGILGAGRVGSAIARTALTAGYAVNISGSGPGSDIEMLVDIVVPGARAMSASDAVANSDLVIIAVPLHKYRTVSPALLSGKIVIDTMNYWEPIDGRLDDFTTDARSSSEVVSDYFTGARVVKTLNHIGYHELEADNHAAGRDQRRALAIAGDDDAASVVAEIIDRFGFDAVYAGPLETGAAFEPGTAIFGGRHTADELGAELGLTGSTTLFSGAEL